MKKLIVFTLIAVLLSAVLLLNGRWVSEPKHPESLAEHLTSNAVVTRQPNSKKAKLTQPLSTPVTHDQMAFSHSLRGTEIDGALQVGEDGNLILNHGVRDFFDYFLSASDELGPQAAISEVLRYIDTYLPLDAAEQAKTLFTNYLRYKQYELTLQNQPISNDILSDSRAMAVLRNSFELLEAKREVLFGAEANQALFGLEQAYQDYTLSSLELFADESLTEEARVAALSKLENTLPPALQHSRAEDALQRREQQEISSLSQAHQDDSVFHQALIERGLDQQKADELLAYRQQQAQFEINYQQYRAATAGIDVSDVGYQGRIDEFRQAFFPDPEQKTQAKLRDIGLVE